MAWIFLIIAGLSEMVLVVGMNRVVERKCFSSIAILAAGFIMSFGMLTLAIQTLPIGMSYAVWTGIGSVGATLLGMIFYGDSRSIKRILLIFVIIISIIGLRALS